MNKIQRERIAVLRSSGNSYAVIAAALGISENTVKSYCRRNRDEVEPESVPTGVCAHCGSAMAHTPGAKKKRFCSDHCRMTWWNAHPEAVTRKAVYAFVCPACGAAFQSYGNAYRIYCSRACSSAVRRGVRG